MQPKVFHENNYAGEMLVLCFTLNPPRPLLPIELHDASKGLLFLSLNHQHPSSNVSSHHIMSIVILSFTFVPPANAHFAFCIFCWNQRKKPSGRQRWAEKNAKCIRLRKNVADYVQLAVMTMHCCRELCVCSIKVITRDFTAFLLFHIKCQGIARALLSNFVIYKHF